MKFQLKKPDKEKPSALRLKIQKMKNGNKVNMNYSTGISLTKEQWSDSRQKVNKISGVPYDKYNRKLRKIKRAVEDVLEENLGNGFNLTSRFIRTQVDAKIGKRNAEVMTTHNSVFEVFEQLHSGIYAKNKGSAKAFKNGWNIAKRFEEEVWIKKTGREIIWNDLNYSFYRNFVSWMESQDYEINYIGTIIKKIRLVMHEAKRRGYSKFPDFDEFKTRNVTTDEIYLSEEEIERLHNLEGLKNYQRNALDWFIIGCWTGMRVDNYLSLSDINVDWENETITAIINKNGGWLTQPMHWMVREILERNDGFPRKISRQKMADYVREVAQLDDAGLSFDVQKKSYRGGRENIEVFPKWKLIKSHTARRSCVTNMYLRNVPVRTIQKITGHKSESQCLKYVKAALHDVPQDLTNLDWWTNKSQSQNGQGGEKGGEKTVSLLSQNLGQSPFLS